MPNSPDYVLLYYKTNLYISTQIFKTKYQIQKKGAGGANQIQITKAHFPTAEYRYTYCFLNNQIKFIKIQI